MRMLAIHLGSIMDDGTRAIPNVEDYDLSDCVKRKLTMPGLIHRIWP